MSPSRFLVRRLFVPRRLLRRLATPIAISLAALALVVPAASAHPLGNFTINHYSGLRVAGDHVVIDQVTDFAEIPTFTERRAMDTDSDGTISDAEAGTFESQRCASLASELRLSADSRPLALHPTHTGLSFPMGQGSPTMRLVCVYRAELGSSLAAVGTAFRFEDTSYVERRGWREIVVQGDGATVVDNNAASAGISARLMTYPTDLLSIPPSQTTAAFAARPGGPALPAFSVPDAHRLAVSPAGATQVAPRPAAAPAAAPVGVTDLGADVTGLFQASDLTPPLILLGLLVAAGLGALHALSPGHGKTVMAAYLVGSRGTMRHAVGLGLTVTISHTLGVLALGALSLSAAAFVPIERLYPILSVGSGGIVAVIGAYLLLSRLRRWQQERIDSRAHAHAREHGHEHSHGHAGNQDSETRPAGWHEHDGIGHTHIPPEGMGRRGLFALGLSGGMIPSVSALLILIGSISIGRPLYGIMLTIAFGLGMAAVLVGVGLAFVYARRLVERMPAAMPLQLGKSLPLVTAAIVLVAGVLITGQGLTALA